MHSAEVKQGKRIIKAALIGNPNCGKTSLFNQLTKLNQKIGNFPGVTVEIKEGTWKMNDGTEVILTDLPGAYSLFPVSTDEKIVTEILLDKSHPNHPDLVIYVADITRLEKHFLLLTQLIDLQIPCILALNMADLAEKSGLHYQVDKLSKKIGIPVVSISARQGSQIDNLKANLVDYLSDGAPLGKVSFYRPNNDHVKLYERLRNDLGIESIYEAKLLAHHHDWLSWVSLGEKDQISQLNLESKFEDLPAQVEEIMQRYDFFLPLIKSVVVRSKHEPEKNTDVTDRLLTHRIFGPLAFFIIMLFVFQAIFSWATIPMDWIELQFLRLGTLSRSLLGAGWIGSLVADGIIAGLSGIMVFVPQIAILFLLINFLEEIGYMSRVVYLFDNLLSRFGMNGRSVVALISGGACAIPAVMSTRTIQNWKERLITILVTPFISCSARIPVYIVLIGFVVPEDSSLWIFNLQGIVFMGLYLLGIMAALLAGLIFKYIIDSKEPSFLMIELPSYKIPQWKNILFAVKDKVFAFVWEAGKIIFLISIVLWFLANYGPYEKMEAAKTQAAVISQERNLSDQEAGDLLEAKKIEASYAGIIGKSLEPAIKPLGYDWKIGIALLTSFAAREVFVGTMATIYSIGSQSDEVSVRMRMAKEKNLLTGEPVYNMATSLSLLIFYVFAMQCMSTLAVVRRETGSWKWPLIQFFSMTGLAYFASLLVYQLLV